MMNNHLVQNDAFKVRWTSFGHGNPEALNPSLAERLGTLTESVSLNLHNACFDVLATSEREDLQLLSYLMTPGVKEFYVYTAYKYEHQYQGEMLEDCTLRQKFTVNKIEGYSVAHSLSATGERLYSTFAVSGVLQVV